MPTRSFMLSMLVSGLVAGPALYAQQLAIELAPMMREGCYGLPADQAAERVAEMEAGLPGLIERRRRAAGMVLATLAEVRRLDRALIDNELILVLGSATVGDRSGMAEVGELRRTLQGRRTQLRDQTRELRMLDLSVRLIESWLPGWRRCRDLLRSRSGTRDQRIAPPPALPPAARVPGAAAVPLAGTTATLRFSEYSRFTDSAGARQSPLGDANYIVLRFTSGTEATGTLEVRGGGRTMPIAGTVRVTIEGDTIVGGWEAPPGRVIGFRIAGARFQAGPGRETVIQGQGSWCSPLRMNPGGLSTQYFGMIWGPVGDQPPPLVPPTTRLC